MNDSAFSKFSRRWQMRALIFGVVAAALSVVGACFYPAQFFHSYLFAWLFWSGLSFGPLIIILMQTLSGGVWGVAVRNLATAASMTLPISGLLFLPVLFGAHQIYGWANGDNGEATGYHHKAQWLNLPFFTGRSIFYFAVFSALALLVRRSQHQDEMRGAEGSDQPSDRTSALSAIGLLLYGFLMIFASTDWLMSLDPKWFSTIFVIIFAAGQFLSSLAFVTCLLASLSAQFSLADIIPAKVFQDLGSMLLAFVIFWTYVSFSQFLIIWSGNLPKEISWYLERSGGGWQVLAIALAALQFLLPFLLLLSRARKRNPAALARICLCILGASILNNFWLVAPSFHPAGFALHWLDGTEFLALGGFWFAAFFFNLRQRPLLPPISLQPAK